MTKPELALWIAFGGAILMVIGMAMMILFNDGRGAVFTILGVGCLGFSTGALK